MFTLKDSVQFPLITVMQMLLKAKRMETRLYTHRHIRLDESQTVPQLKLALSLRQDGVYFSYHDKE